ncbi:hypothetical protein C8A03DRAFT_16586 [Achaetomium macrosporum]|uniref:DUF7730 domain-containing protein n=1 Tax=Achaetomium macrosporum TaxID=79813 RepID=A0AAN7C7T5_9PEZI|nr:hypothetical protein C8A03DRAFT_16586 [Achaetomium macrosporum]
MATSQPVCAREAGLLMQEGGNRPEENDAARKFSGALAKRTLTLRCPDGSNDIDTQQQSLLFARLPLEIRFRIYALVLPPHRRLWIRPVSQSAPGPNDDETSGYLEHFPCNRPPTDTTWASPSWFRCCTQAHNGFFENMAVNGIRPHADSLALMQTCQQVYVETCRLWTFCFDRLDTMRAFTRMTRHLPVRHIQVMLWQRRMAASWERQLTELAELCKEIPQLGTLMLSVHAKPRFSRLENQDAVRRSLGVLGPAAQRVRVEWLCWQARENWGCAVDI